MPGPTTGVMTKIPGKKDKTYIWQRSLECEKIMTLLENPHSGSVWDTFISKSSPEVTQSGTTQPSAKSSNVKENSGKTKEVRRMQRPQYHQK